MENNTGWVEPTEPQWIALDGSENWAKCTIFQGDRLLAVIAEQNRLNMIINENQENIFDFMEQLKVMMTVTKWEEEFFLFALDRAIFSLKEAAKFYPEFQAFVTNIETAIGPKHVKDVRDMRTHIDAYSKGKGKEQDRFIYESPEELYPVKPLAEHLFAADATSTIIFPNAYLIGGRVNVQVALEVMNKLLPDIINSCQNYMCPSQMQR